MEPKRRLLAAAMESDESFSKALRESIESLGMTIQEFSKRAGVSPSTLYKITNEGRSPSLDVLRRIIRAIGEASGARPGNFIAVVAARHVLEDVLERSIQIEDESVRVRDYPAATVEDAIVAAIRAEREGAIAVVCAPIVSPTIEKIIDIPIALIDPKDSMLDAIKVAAKKSRV
jgi:predicted transcriptional regulator